MTAPVGSLKPLHHSIADYEKTVLQHRRDEATRIALESILLFLVTMMVGLLFWR